MLTLIAFIVAILILVSLHEFGHYIVARWCGVKVLRFSVGFGKPFYTKKRGDTEWCLAPIPLGGYVKMVDTREGNVAEADLPYAFDKQHPAKRIAIVAAGPLTNLALAALLYGISFSFGVTQIKPWVGTVENGSIAAQAGFMPGDRIEAVNGQAVKDWQDAQTAIVLNLDAGKVTVDVRDEAGNGRQRVIDAAGTEAARQVAKTARGVGMLPFKYTTVLGVVAKGSPAERAGLKKGDRLLAVDGQILTDWQMWVEAVRNSPGRLMQVVYARGGQTFQTALRPDAERRRDGSLTGRAGVGAEDDKAWSSQVRSRYVPPVGEAFKMGWDKMAGYSELTLRFFGKLLTGQASLDHISGPVTIADVAGKSAKLGIQSYLEFLALVSVSLGIMNLLPVPVLDGGHLVYYTAEWLRGRPLSEQVQNIGMRIGLAVMLMMMALAFFNDITRLFG